MAKINYNAMFVTPYGKKRKGAYIARMRTVWDDEPYHERYFGAAEHKNPKLLAQQYTIMYLEHYYGKVRASYIMAIPHFVEKMKFGGQVNVFRGTHTSRGKKYKKIVVTWTKYEQKNHRYVAKRCQKHWLYNEDNLVFVEHKATLFAAEKRAEMTYSNLHKSALSFEYDLS